MHGIPQYTNWLTDTSLNKMIQKHQLVLLVGGRTPGTCLIHELVILERMQYFGFPLTFVTNILITKDEVDDLPISLSLICTILGIILHQFYWKKFQ